MINLHNTRELIILYVQEIRAFWINREVLSHDGIDFIIMSACVFILSSPFMVVKILFNFGVVSGRKLDLDGRSHLQFSCIRIKY